MLPRILTLMIGMAMAGAAADDGPTMIMKAAEQVAYADTLIESCRYDEAAHWLDRALHSARDTRSANGLVRDTAGGFVGRLEIKRQEFHDQRRAWERAAADVRRLMASNRLESARARLDRAGAPACDPELGQLRREVDTRASEAAAVVLQADRTRWNSPRSALELHERARSLDAEIDAAFPDVARHMAEASHRVPKRCTACRRAAASPSLPPEPRRRA